MTAEAENFLKHLKGRRYLLGVLGVLLAAAAVFGARSSANTQADEGSDEAAAAETTDSGQTTDADTESESAATEPDAAESDSAEPGSAEDAPMGGSDVPVAVPLPDRPGVLFSEDFTEADAMSRFEFGVFHRDDHLVRDTEWLGDHQPKGPDDLCGPPDEKRVIVRGERPDFNDDWIYRCVPGGDLEKAHVMTSIGPTSGYSIGAFSPALQFEDVREVRWDVNQTDLGARQWTEIAVIPADYFDFQMLPCIDGVPCSTLLHSDIGSVGTHWAGPRVRNIITPEQPGGFSQAGGDLGYRCDGCPYAPGRRFGEDYGPNDPALTSITIRRGNFFRDNGDGTLTWGYELDDGSFHEFTAPGEFPQGAVRVVFKDHNYTPMKSPATLLPETFFTWHWDNVEVLTDPEA